MKKGTAMRKTMIATFVLAATLGSTTPAFAVSQEESDAKGAFLTSLGVDAKRYADQGVVDDAVKAVRDAALMVGAAHKVAGLYRPGWHRNAWGGGQTYGRHGR
jgi:hypothetical protein